MEILVLTFIVLIGFIYLGGLSSLKRIVDIGNREIVILETEHKAQSLERLSNIKVSKNEIKKAKAVLSALDEVDF